MLEAVVAWAVLLLFPLVWLAGVVQTALYCDFFYNYFMAKKRGIDAPVKIQALPV